MDRRELNLSEAQFPYLGTRWLAWVISKGSRAFWVFKWLSMPYAGSPMGALDTSQTRPRPVLAEGLGTGANVW